MTSRSFDSVASARRNKDRMTDADVYQYALRVSYLSYLMTPRPIQHSSATTDGDRDRDSLRDSTHSRIQGAISSSIYSIGDLFKDSRDGTKTVKFPERLLKVLDSKLQNIAMGKDPQYSDHLIRRTIAVFWGSLKEPNFLRQMEKNRKIEELILMFVTTATSALKKEPSLAGDGWKLELNSQVATFVRILRDCLRQVSHVPPELTSRVEMYVTKMSEGVNQAKAAGSVSPYNGGGGTSASPPPTHLTGNVADMTLARTVGKLFGKNDVELQQDINAIKRFCTEKAALVDLKTCLKNINAETPFPGRRDDFGSDDAFHHWRTQEMAHLSQLMVIMVQLNPEIAKSSRADDVTSPYSAQSSRPDSIYSARSGDPLDRQSSASRYSAAAANGNWDAIAESDDEVEVGHNFTYIPPNPKKYYKRLLELALQFDLEQMVNLPEDQEVPLGILSSKHVELINECALRWRTLHSYRVACFLDVIKYKYERDEVPMECIPEAFQMITKAMHELPLEKWPLHDSDMLATVYGGMFNIFLGLLYESLQDVTKLKYSQIEPYIAILDTITSSGLVERYRVDIDARIDDLADQVRVQAVHQYTDKNYELTSEAGENKALPLLYLTDHLEKQAKLLDKRFPEPVLGRIDIVSLALESQIALFLTDLDNTRPVLLQGSLQGPTGQDPTIPIEDIFALYRRTKTLLSMHAAFCPKSVLSFDVSVFFEPFVRQWLVTTDNKTAQWVHTAFSVDKFEAEGPEGHSSSIVDLFASLKSPIDFLMDLNWEDEYQEARFFTALSKTISKSIEQYCRSVEELFMEEMFPRPPPTETPVPKQNTFALFERAKVTLQGEKKVEPFNFTAQSCVKLNNIEAARKLLDNMYARIDADKLMQILDEHGPPVPEKNAPDRPRFLFTVKIAMAENLVPTDSNPSAKLDTFVTLSDEKGVRLAKTRTIYETLDPRWDETFDISVENPLWLMASVRDRALIGKHDTVGRAYLCLDPRRFGDYMAHELWLDLDTTGRMLFRVSMEGEKDDIQFYFGRAFRSLKRAEADMTRIIIDKMAPLVQYHLSRTVVKSLIKTTPALDYNKAYKNLTAFYKSTMGGDSSEPVIPLPQSEKPRFKPEALTDVEIEAAIAPLFDYFDANLQVLNTSLSDSARETVMAKAWKEILATIEGLLIPPLSNTPSDLRPLSDKEVDIVFKWLKFLRDYFYAGGEGPVPLEALQNQKYREVLSIRLYYDWDSDLLMEECVRMMQQSLRSAPAVKKRAKTVYAQRNLGTIRERKKEKKQEEGDNNSEVIMRILRMRPNTSEFISQQLAVAASAQAEQQKRASMRRSQKGNNRMSRSPMPPVPPLPK